MHSTNSFPRLRQAPFPSPGGIGTVSPISPVGDGFFKSPAAANGIGEAFIRNLRFASGVPDPQRDNTSGEDDRRTAVSIKCVNSRLIPPETEAPSGELPGKEKRLIWAGKKRAFSPVHIRCFSGTLCVPKGGFAARPGAAADVKKIVGPGRSPPWFGGLGAEQAPKSP